MAARPRAVWTFQVALILTVGAATLRLGSWGALGIYGLVAIAWGIWLRVPLRSLSRWLGAEAAFLALLALPLGIDRAGFLWVRSLVCLALLNSVLLTVPPQSAPMLLASLPLPRQLREILLLATQAIDLLQLEVRQMQRAGACRGIAQGRAGWLRYASAAMIGSLYLRSLDRAERIYHAMVVRGYRGALPAGPPSTARERVGLAIAVGGWWEWRSFPSAKLNSFSQPTSTLGQLPLLV